MPLCSKFHEEKIISAYKQGDSGQWATRHTLFRLDILSTLAVFLKYHDKECIEIAARLPPGEEDLVANAVENRRREFVTARRAPARPSPGSATRPPRIRSGPMREPQWPSSLVGSITHTRGFRAAAVAPRSVLSSVGIDTELNCPLPDGVEELVTVTGEPRCWPRLPAPSHSRTGADCSLARRRSFTRRGTH